MKEEGDNHPDSKENREKQERERERRAKVRERKREKNKCKGYFSAYIYIFAISRLFAKETTC